MKTTTQSLPDTATAIGDLIQQGLTLNVRLFEALSDSSLSLMNRVMSPSMFSGLTQKMSVMPSMAGGRIPSPCWMPQSIGEISSYVCPGGTATVRMRISNCGATKRDVKVEAVSRTQGVTITPTDLALGSMEHEWATASFPVPAEASVGQEYEALIWVRGCKDHYLPWTVKVSSRGSSCCHEVEVEDCPDLIHHWYDHFYCAHPCQH